MKASVRLREALRGSLTPVSEVRVRESERRPAAVLLPFVEGSEPSIVFTKRTDDLPRHPGEISFPGGMRSEGDVDPLATALRETEEELGLSRDLVDVLGALEPLETFTTGFTIVPFVGALEADPAFAANPSEIAEVLEFPVSRLLEVERPMSWDKEGQTWWGHVCELDGHTIWGATGRILHEFLELLRKENP
ncbi:MAG: CoA pyrophosphatase [Actinomycetota bacterium]